MDDLLKKLFGDQEGVLTEESKSVIVEAFNAKVDEAAEERIQLAVEAMDKTHTGMLQQLVEKYEGKINNIVSETETKIDEEHAEALETVFEQIDKDRANKMVTVKEHYEGLLKESVTNHVDTLVESIDQYLDTFLEDHIPNEIVEEAARKTHSETLLSQISKLITIDETVNEDVRAGIYEAKQTITQQAQEIDRLKCEKLIAEKTAKLPKLEQQFLKESLKGKDSTYIQRNFDYVRSLYEKSQSEPVSNTVSDNVARKTEVIVESHKPSEEGEVKSNPVMAGWANSAKGKTFYE